MKYIQPILLFFFLASKNLTAENIDSLKNKLTGRTVSEKGKIFYDIGSYYLNKREIDSCIKYSSEAIEFLKSDVNLSNTHENLGMAYYYRNEFSEALFHFKKSLKYSLNTGKDSIIARRYSDLGVIYDYLGTYDKASENYFKALKLFEKISDTQGIAKIYNNLGIINETFEKYKLALNYYKKSLKLKKQAIFNKQNIASTYVNIGSVNEKLNNNKEALFYYKKALKIFKTFQNDKYTGLCLNNIAEIYIKEKKYDKAKNILNEAIILSSGKEGNMNIAKSYLLFAEVLIDKNKLSEAEIFFQKSMQIAKSLKLTSLREEILKKFIKLYALKKDFKSAFLMQSDYLQLKDSINTQKLKEKTEHLQIIYETDKKEQKIQLLEKDLNKKRILWLAAILVVLMISAFVFLILKNKLNKSIIKNYVFNQKLLRSQMNPHFIFNALNSVQSFILKNDKKQAVKYLSAFSKLTRSILNNSRNEFVSIQEEIDTIENYLKIQKVKMFGKFDYEISVDARIDTDYYMIPPMLSQPFTENALIHGFKDIDYKGFIIINFKIENNLLLVSVEDNGSGITEIKSKNHKSYATEITLERLSILKKQSKTNIDFKIINLKDTIGKNGTKVIFTLPLIKNSENV